MATRNNQKDKKMPSQNIPTKNITQSRQQNKKVTKTGLNVKNYKKSFWRAPALTKTQARGNVAPFGYGSKAPQCSIQ